MDRPKADSWPGPLAALGLFYACAYAATGITLPYLPQHLRSLGLSGSQLGLLLASYPLMTMLVPPLFGLLADRTRRGALLLSAICLGGALCFVPLLFAGDAAAVAPWLLGAAFCNAPLSMLADSLTLERLGPRAGRFPRVRLWGSLGYVASATAFSLCYSGEPASPPPVVVAALGALGLTFAASLLVRGQAGAPQLLGARDALSLFKDGRLRLLLAAGCVHWLACTPFHLLFAVFMRQRGLPQAATGLGLGLGVVAEVAVMLAFPRLSRTYSARALLAASFVASALRWTLMGLTVSAVPMVLLQLLHGFTFGAFMVSAVTLLNQLAPGRLRASAQALFASVAYGLGGTVGYLAFGRLFDWLPARTLFFLAAGLEIVPLALVLLLPREAPRGADGVLGFPEVSP